MLPTGEDRFDFLPLFRSTIGFDRVTRLLDAATRVDSASLGYPPYNIEKTGEDGYRLTMAVAGFDPSEILHENTLAGDGQGAEGRGEEERKRLPAPRHRAPRVRAAFPPRRSHEGHPSRQRHAACRPGA